MMNARRFLVGLFASASILAAVEAQAGGVVSNLYNGTPRDVGAPKPATAVGSGTVFATDFNSKNADKNLCIKNDGPGEQGLGFVGTPNHEISLNKLGTKISDDIQLDISHRGVTRRGHIDSVSASNRFQVFGATKNQVGDIGDATPRGTAPNLPNPGSSHIVGFFLTAADLAYKHLDVATAPDGNAPRKNVLLHSFGALVLESGTMIMLGSAAVGGIGIALRRRSKPGIER